MAVQLAQLSLWLATLSAERPLSFLDHHIRRGDSLIGASPEDLIARPPGAGRRARQDVLPLEQFFDRSEALAALLPLRARSRTAQTTRWRWSGTRSTRWPR